MNIGTGVTGLTTFILYTLIIYHLYIDMNSTFENYLKSEDLLHHTAWFCGITMAASAFAILASFFFMYRALIK